MADDVGEMLMQRAAEGDVEHLGPAADAQHRQPRRSAASSSANSQASRSRPGSSVAGWGTWP
ncbi:putative glutamine amidotransferase domain protein [Mycobacterium xenopi 4042]|uniref:Putative glutamine amidotransferase domain protein n=1 Tax=Mycobacterium xenopi 4042 TaxID=1299334 RepID=X8E740_MYCXE|nr:putative glutamine amidotransferase domain protein [Mycobacterium xenopi 4042]